MRHAHRNSGIAVLLALAGAIGAALWADDTGKPAAPAPPEPKPRVSIQPRPSTAKENPADRRRPNFVIDSSLVLINVTVTDPRNKVVTGMDKEHFKLLEDGVEQEILKFGIEEAPVSIGLVFDVSGSMGNKLTQARRAAAAFFDSANPQDEFFLVQFSDAPRIMVPWTRNTAEIQNRMTFTQAKGRTALLDGIYMAMEEMKKAHNPRKAILILSDGADNSSRYSFGEIRNNVREADVQIYGIGIYESIGGRGRTPEELSGPSLLSDIASETGGRSFNVDNLNDLPDIASKIGNELRSQYILGYTSTNTAKDGKYRKVEVKINQSALPRGLPQLRAYYRPGYYAPSE